MASRSATAARQLIKTAVAAPRASTRTAVPLARTFASAPSRSNASTSSSVTLDQLRNASQPLPSKRVGSSASTSTVSETDGVPAAQEEEQFVLPNCLLPTESLPPTHGIHVATLHLRSYEDGRYNLDLFADFARRAAFAIGIPASGVAHLPTRTSLWTVPRSPFVHKKSQENFWRKRHSRAIKLYDANDQVVDRWLHFLRIHALPGVGQKAELFRYHELGVGDKLMEEAKALQRSASAQSSTGKEKSQAVSATEGSDAEKIKKIADGIVEKEIAQEGSTEQK